MATRWVIAGGGTGGHVTPGLALAESIVSRGDEVLFVGSARGFESKMVPAAGFDLEVLPSEQVMGRSLLGRVRGATSILRSVPAARGILKRFQADAVISVGGYAAMPAALAARVSGKPLFLVEPNAIPGRVNRLTARFATTVFLAFESAAERLPPGIDTASFGVPLGRALKASFKERETARAPQKPIRLFIFGGSQGARQLNEAVPEALKRLAPKSIEVFHQSGEAEREQVEARYAETAITAEVVAFERDMPARYQWADLAICRAGALTVAELCLAGMPALLVPYPFAADDHQTANARAFETSGAGRCLDPRPLDPKALSQAIAEYVQAPGRLSSMREAALGLARPNAADDVIDYATRRMQGLGSEAP